MTDYAPPLLVRAWQKARHVDERKKRDVEGVTEADEPGALHARVYVERPRKHGRLVPDDADGPPIEPGEADDQVLGPAFLNLEELPVVDHSLYGTSNVVGALGGVGDQTRQVLVHPLRIVGGPEVRGALQIILRQEGEQVAHVVEAGLLVGRRKVGYTDLVLWVAAPPRSSKETSSPVTLFMTSGPVMNMWLVSSTMNTKSVMAGEYTAPPAQGPTTTEIWGTTPEASTLRWKMSA